MGRLVPPSMEQLIASVPACPIVEAVAWLKQYADDELRPAARSRWKTAEGLLLTEEDALRRYRLKRARHNIAQGIG